MKANAKLTQRISSKFATQLANNDYARVVIERVFDYIRPLCSQNHSAERATVVESDEHAMAECYYDSDECSATGAGADASLSALPSSS